MGFLDYGKEKSKSDSMVTGGEENVKPAEDQGDESEDPQEMRLMMLAEKTGIENPKALIALIKACSPMSMGEE